MESVRYGWPVYNHSEYNISDQSDRDSILDLAGHHIERRRVYAGGSQWCQANREWDCCESGWAWVVDGRYILCGPSMFGFDGHNTISRTTPFYLQSDYATNPPEHSSDAEPLDACPLSILIALGRQIAAARAEAEKIRLAEEEAAAKLLEKL